MPYFALIIMFYHVKIECYQILFRNYSTPIKEVTLTFKIF